MRVAQVARMVSVTVTAFKSFYQFRRLVLKYSRNRAKDFDLYYFVILAMQLSIAVAHWVVPALFIVFGYVKENPENMVCSPSILVFTNSILAICFLQLSFNWLEVSGESPFLFQLQAFELTSPAIFMFSFWSKTD